MNNLQLMPVPPYPAVPLVLAKTTVPGVGPNQLNPVPGIRGMVHKACINEQDTYTAANGRVTYTFDLQPPVQAAPSALQSSVGGQAADYVRCQWPLRNGVRWVMDFPNRLPVLPSLAFQNSIIVPRLVYDTMGDPRYAARIVEMREFLLGVRNIAPSPYDELPGTWPDLETFIRWLLRDTSDIHAVYCALYQIRYNANIDIHGRLRNMIQKV
ncbi:hypothetical protein AAVH_14683 [Aphelenchoides avenae]|nr:hypothetical protein AAVH_14683 [Aphelenchus avenae]